MLTPDVDRPRYPHRNRKDIAMIDVSGIEIPELAEGSKSRIMNIPVAKAGDTIPLEVNALGEQMYTYLLFLGAKAVLARGMSNVTKAEFPNEEDRNAEAAEIAKKTLADLYAGKVRMTGMVKEKGLGRGEVNTEAMRIAREDVKAQLKEEGFRVSLIKPAFISKLARELIENDPEILAEAKTNVEKRKAAGKKKRIDLSQVTEDAELVKKAEAKGRGRKRVQEDEEVPPPRRGGTERRIGA